jgi:hypothetical protein
MMLPRSNKNTLKININRSDDEEDIELKREVARLNMKKNRSENIGEMDAESTIRKSNVLSQQAMNQMDGMRS